MKLVNGNQLRKKQQVDNLVDVYNDIRYTTFALMSEIANELQDDFHSWKTDCIFCTNNELIINKVKSIILSYGLNCKIEI
jgi:hypothetical protein